MAGVEAIITARALAVGYGRRRVLTGVDLEVRPGEFWFFLGPNGHGKSTLLKVLLGQLRPLAGSVSVRADVARGGRLAFVPQRCDLNPTLPTTVREFVSLGLSGLRVPGAERARRIDWALDRVALSGLAGRSYWSLSGGQRQRALVARALVRRPALLVLDEPTNGLDLAAEELLLGELATLNGEEALTVIHVTHQLGQAVAHATHVALFAGGQVVAGPRSAVLTAAALARTYEVPEALAAQVLKAARPVGAEDADAPVVP